MTDDANPPALRAGDADRERTVAVLGVHAAHGRLTVEELGERTDAAYAARTMAELDRLVADLPEVEPDQAVSGEVVTEEEEEVRAALRHHVASYLLVNLMLIGIWAATGMGYFWPIFPLLGWGVGIGMHAFSAREDVRRLRAAPAEQRPEILARSQERNRKHSPHGPHGPHGLHPPPSPRR